LLRNAESQLLRNAESQLLRNAESQLLRNAESRLRGSHEMRETEDSPSRLGLVMSKGVTVDKEDMGRLILESLDDVLGEIFGKSMRQAFYDVLERNYYISRDDIPSQLGNFLLILQRNFGKNATAVRRDIAQRLAQKLVAGQY